MLADFANDGIETVQEAHQYLFLIQYIIYNQYKDTHNDPPVLVLKHFLKALYQGWIVSY